MNPELAVEERLRRLEYQVRRARMWSVAMSVALGAVVFASMQAPQAKQFDADLVRVRRIELIDASGAVRGSLGLERELGEEAIALELLAAPGSGTKAILWASSTAGLSLKHESMQGSLELVAEDRSAMLTVNSGNSPKTEGGWSRLRSQDGDTWLDMVHTATEEPYEGWFEYKSARVRLSPDEGLEQFGH
ncbi:MAG: hypothetical protein HZA53_05255 [Planctomycetes bacterium]|nr:hypothetical protein [Planctomycetota bacterium]